MTDQDLVRTRIALHAVGELVMAGPQYRASDTIRLRVAPGGFRTWAAPELAVDGADLVAPGTRIPVSGRTARELASAVGVDAGAPAGLYADGSGVGPDETLAVDPAAAAHLADVYARGAAALRPLALGVEPVLWPEHFDLAVGDRRGHLRRLARRRSCARAVRLRRCRAGPGGRSVLERAVRRGAPDDRLRRRRQPAGLLRRCAAAPSVARHADVRLRVTVAAPHATLH